MALTKQDIIYATNSNVRIKTRLFIALLVGIFANWEWLFILCVIFGFGEFLIMYKILKEIRNPDDTSRPEEKGKRTGYNFGTALFSALIATFSVIAVAAIVKLIKMGILIII